MNAMALSRQYFCDIAEPLLKRDFPNLYQRIAAGLVGNGSECYGYDDEISRDHDWGVDFFIWVLESDGSSIGLLQKWKNSLFNTRPPEFMRTRSEYGARISVMTVGDFYASLVGYQNGPGDIAEWRRIPEENLAMAVNGEVFTDNAGEFTATRHKLLHFYPEDIRRKKLAAKCMAIAQTGQYNLGRCYKRKDWVAFRTVLSRFNDNVIAAVFLLNKVYRPYYKWAYKKMTELPILGEEIGALLENIAETCGIDKAAYDSIQKDTEKICALIIDVLKRQNLAQSDDWFLATHGEEIQSSIKDSFLRALPAQYE